MAPLSDSPEASASHRHRLRHPELGHSVEDVHPDHRLPFEAMLRLVSTMNIQLPFASSRILVVSDFNCPYCFTLNEWLEKLGKGSSVRWIGIEHRPSLPTSGENNQNDTRTLLTELADVQSRAPEVGVVSPASWVNSNLAVLLQNAVEDEYPELAPTLRTRIFRSYWREGLVISQPEVLAEICADLDIPKIETEEDYLRELTEWWSLQLDRIPCMLAPTGVVHLGLQDFASVQSFVSSAIHASSTGPGCSPGGR